MRIVFMGTPSFAVPSLEILAEQQHVVAVVTQPDKAQGRGQKIGMSPVKKLALGLGIPVLQPRRVADPQFIKLMQDLRPDLCVVVAFGQKIPDTLLELPPFGCINLHSSLLPKYRGAAPINKAIAEGDGVTGVTTMYLSSEWDAGDIILQAEEPILPEDTAGTLHDRLMVKGADLLAETVRQIAAGTAPRTPQDHSQATYAFKLTKDDAYLDFREDAEKLSRLVRAMNPWPTAHTNIQGESIKVWEAVPLPGQAPPGQIESLTETALVVGCGSGLLALEKVQRPGRKVISGRDLANGLRLKAGQNIMD
ncbi:MAG TPA: methionyl-tRNA formyltransferase [Firmicutes bacterium]|jgi:methionyl-tRNA formyltransferase|nr:MAG: hypothetical protein AA931_03645 [Peptococcaceae bacterium 1109]HHT74350.1 methionyl-tRNA formyltransferase [Bacillota bacterium]